MAFERVEYVVQESDGIVDVCVEVVHPSVVEREFSLSISSTDGDACKSIVAKLFCDRRTYICMHG